MNFARRVYRAGTLLVGLQRRDLSADVDVLGTTSSPRPKRLILACDTGHRTTQEQVDDVNDWIVDELTGRGRSSATK